MTRSTARDGLQTSSRAASRALRCSTDATALLDCSTHCGHVQLTCHAKPPTKNVETHLHVPQLPQTELPRLFCRFGLVWTYLAAPDAKSSKSKRPGNDPLALVQSSETHSFRLAR